MEELEKLIKRCKECKLNECINCDICWSEVQEIENLLTRVKELDEENKYEWIRQNCLPMRLVNQLYIPKTKIREKIEEYKKMMKERPEHKAIIEIHINELQDLLEE